MYCFCKRLILLYSPHLKLCPHCKHVVHGIVLVMSLLCPFCCSMSPYPFFTSHHYFAADINLNSADTPWLIKLTDQEIFDCLCVLVSAFASPRVLREFMGWCHCYAVLPSRDLQNSHHRFYAVWQSPERRYWERGKTSSFMAQTVCVGGTAPQTQCFFSTDAQGNHIE